MVTRRSGKSQSAPSRSTVSPLQWGGTTLFGGRRSEFPSINLEQLGALYQLSRGEEIPIAQVRKFAKTPPGARAVSKVTNGVLAMPMIIKPRNEKDKEKESSWERAKIIDKCLRRPNVELNNTWRKLVTALMEDLLVAGAAAVERQPGQAKDRPFWLWDVDIAHVHLNPEWNPQNELQHPRYLIKDPTKPNANDFIAMRSQDLFLIRHKASTYEVVSSGPMRVAYRFIQLWLGVGDYQDVSTHKATRNAILQLIDADEEELQSFREYWNYQIEGQGEIPIVNKKIEIASLNAPDDSALYLQYEEKLLRIIALAFDLSVRDFNITEPDNKATAGVAADESFQGAILPYGKTLVEHMDQEIVEFYDPDFKAELADTEPRSEEQEANRAVTVFQGGLATRDEGRQMAGLPPIGGDEGAAFADGKPAEETKAGEEEEEEDDLNGASRNKEKRSAAK